MIKRIAVCGLLAVAAVASASAEEFALTFRTIPGKDVMAFTGGYGVGAQLRLVKPPKLKNEPKAVSRHPLYAEIDEKAGNATWLLRLDESKGDGKGYDQLLVDMNQNGDLTDETPASVVVLPAKGKKSSPPPRQKLFGPIPAAEGKLILGERPMYFAQVYVSDVSSMLRSGQSLQGLYAGYIRLKAGWYAEATVELKGVKQKVGIFDSDSNGRLGDFAKPQTYHNEGEPEGWYFRAGDSWLVDADGSGAFEQNNFDTEWCSYSPVLYFGATPHHAALTPDGNAIKVEPCTEDLAEVALQPHGEQVCSVTLAWEQPDAQWRLIRAGVAGGKIKVPPGNYRLWRCELQGKAEPGDLVRVGAYQHMVQKPFAFAAGADNTLRCGAPLEIKVKAEKKIPQSWERNRNDQDNTPAADSSQYVLSINADVYGAGGEAYMHYGKGEKFADDPPQPTFRVTDAQGSNVGHGKLEFG